MITDAYLQHVYNLASQHDKVKISGAKLAEIIREVAAARGLHLYSPPPHGDPWEDILHKFQKIIGRRPS